MMTKSEGIGVPNGDLFARYAAATGRFDEMAGADGALRPHWVPFVQRFGAFLTTEQAQRNERLHRLVQENGIAQNLFTEAHSKDEPWRIDLIPLIIAPEEWAFLEAGIIQRAKLLSAVLDDVYGEQRLLQSGHIPPQLVLGDPAFLRPLSGAPAGRGRLSYCAFDVARDASGRWRVVDTHTETLAGLGFALANRIVHSRVASDLFLVSRAVRLAPFFTALQSELIARAGRSDAPMALLTPGAQHEDYFGHAYLARYLSLLLVEGGDLRVVSNRLFMKTLEGLRPIELILRCVAGEQADPLQLDPNGYLGPAGFVQALQVNPNLCTNAIGTAIVENLGLGPYYSELAREVLDEDLKLPQQPRLWLGDTEARKLVLGNFDRLAIRPAQGGTGRPGHQQWIHTPQRMTAEGRATLRRQIEIGGHHFVAEDRSDFGTLPSWTPGGLEPQPFVVRLFATMVDGEYIVMPGGIALEVDAAHGYGQFKPRTHSRDVWVTSDGPVAPHVSPLRISIDAPKIVRSGAGLRSRIADNLFWLGRYSERADWTMRLLRASLARLDPDTPVMQHRETVVRTLDVLLAKDDRLVKLPPDDAAIEQRARALMSGRGRSYGLLQTIGSVHRIAGLIRDRLSSEVWRTLQIFQTLPIWTGDAEPGSLAEALEALDQGLATLAAFNGLAAENMTRNYGWNFLEIGRRVERSANLAELVATLFAERQDEASEAASLTFALEVADSILTYRSRYLFAPSLPLVLDLLLADDTNPRSIVFQLASISEHLSQLPKSPDQPVHAEERKLILDLLTRAQLADVYELARAQPNGTREAFKTLFTAMVKELPQLSEAITRRYFSLTEDEMTRINTRLGPRP